MSDMPQSDQNAPPPPPPPPPSSPPPVRQASSHAPAPSKLGVPWADFLKRLDAEDKKMAIPAKYSPQWWFVYFRREAIGVAGRKGQDPAKQTIMDIHEKELQWNFAKIDGMGAPPVRNMLTKLLQIGFRGVRRPWFGGLSSDATADNIIHCCRVVDPKKEVEIGWRSEARSWEAIVEQKGTKRQVEVDTLAKEMKISESWHPFSQGQYRNYLWFRAGVNLDSDFRSVISVGEDIQTVISFPQLDAEGYPDLPKAPNGLILAPCSWSLWKGDFQKNAQYVARVRDSRGQTHDLLGTRVYVYMFLIRGLVLNTPAAATKYTNRALFPEKGLQHIALDDIYACFPAIRVHHQEKENNHWVCSKMIGHTVFLKDPHFTMTEQQRRCRYPENVRLKFDQEFQKVPAPRYPRPAFSAAWTDAGHGDAKKLKDPRGEFDIAELISLGDQPSVITAPRPTASPSDHLQASRK
ncbi:MAG TPA: hypothetical protein VJA21_08690 [Verrucomicrobiae bacterium]